MTARRMLEVALFAALFVPVGARADGVIVARSEIGFTLKQMGVTFEGRFTKWKADVAFRPKSLASSKAAIDVDLASIDLASGESEGEAREAQWFNTAKFPVAHFMSTSIRDIGGSRYDVAGKLTLKGITHDFIVPIAVRTDATGNRIAEGRFSLKRLDYRIGEGEWADTDIVDNDVVVRIRMVLTPAA